jgi:CubicO group peptidase (beta-lactamase class C family)
MVPAENRCPSGRREPPTRHGTLLLAYAAAGGLYTTPTDFARFLIEVIDPKPGDPYRLKRESLEEMLRPHVKVNDTISQALGWQILHTEKGDFICHGGGNPGFSAFVVASVERKSGAVITTNSEDGYRVVDKLIGGEILPQFLGARLQYPVL